jgi:hypothetical protein
MLTAACRRSRRRSGWRAPGATSSARLAVNAGSAAATVDALVLPRLELRLGYSAAQAGAALIPESAVFLVVAPLSGVRVSRVGRRCSWSLECWASRPRPPAGTVLLDGALSAASYWLEPGSGGRLDPRAAPPLRKADGERAATPAQRPGIGRGRT